MTKAKIIEETANYYNLSNRGYNDEAGECSYLDEKGNMCAVGRCLNEKALNVAKSFIGDVDMLQERLEEELDIAFDEALKEEYRGHELMFWQALQRFHDHQYNFNSTGLSEIGQENKKKLLHDWSEK